MKQTMPVLLTATLGWASFACQASNWQWLRNSSLGDFSDADGTALSQSLQNTLNAAKDGESRHWNTPESGNQGDIRILDTLADTTIPRQGVRFSPHKSGAPLTFCKSTGGSRLIRSRPAET